MKSLFSFIFIWLFVVNLSLSNGHIDKYQADSSQAIQHSIERVTYTPSNDRIAYIMNQFDLTNSQAKEFNIIIENFECGKINSKEVALKLRAGGFLSDILSDTAGMLKLLLHSSFIEELRLQYGFDEPKNDSHIEHGDSYLDMARMREELGKLEKREKLGKLDFCDLHDLGIKPIDSTNLKIIGTIIIEAEESSSLLKLWDELGIQPSYLK